MSKRKKKRGGQPRPEAENPSAAAPIEETAPEVEEAPAVVEEAPAEVEEAPAEVEEAPAEVEEAPAEVEEAPAEVEESPDEVEEVPHEVEEAPAEVEEAPAEVEESPAEVENAPAEVEEAPAEEKKGKKKNKKNKRKKPSEEKKGEEEQEADDFGERKLTESEKVSLHERFKFDWELEENIIEALDEDAAELDDGEEETPEPEPIHFKSITFAQAAQMVFGLFLLIFSIVGVIATGFKIRDVIAERKDNSEQIAALEEFIMPLVACDTPTFDGAQSLNEDVIITAACWDIIFNPSVYYENSGGSYSVSYIDVDRRITKLFGSGLSYTHKTVGDVDLNFEYDEETGMYTIPAYPRAPAYYPEITDISPAAGGTELTVCYRLPITNWIDSVDTVEKTMIYTVVPTDSGYNVTAIRIGEIVASEEV